MHRHSYSGRKLQLAKDQRRALIRGQVTSLVLYEKIRTTEAKAKEIAPYFERMVTKAKSGTLANQRALRAFLLTEASVQKMIQELAPAFAERNGGYTRIIKVENRRGDNAKMAVVSLVLPDKIETAKPANAKAKDAKSKPAPVAKKAPAKEKTHA
jgi:large subunit ribosomal protein L17